MSHSARRLAQSENRLCHIRSAGVRLDALCLEQPTSCLSSITRKSACKAEVSLKDYFLERRVTDVQSARVVVRVGPWEHLPVFPE